MILSAVFVATLGATAYLTYTMLNLNSLIQEGGEDVRAAYALQDMMLNLRQAESGQRGYIITGNEGYLKPFNQAIETMPKDLKSLQGQKAMAQYKGELDQLEVLTKQRIIDLQRGVDARRTGGFEAAAAVVTATQSSQLTAKIRTLTSNISIGTAQSIGPKQAQSRASLKHSLVITVVLDIFILITCATIARYFQRAIVKERAIEGAKNEFLSLASHQLRTPATSVKQYLGMLQGGFFGDLNPEQKEAVSTAYASNETGISIINSLLNAAKLSLGKIQLTRKPTKVADVVREVINECREAAVVRGQTITFTNSMRSRKARIDPTYFKTVVENLVDNAIKYSRDGGAIAIRLKVLEDTKRFVLTVSDNGLGINKQDFSKLFLKFSRLQNDYSETSEGSGLGLYWVKQVVELHGGTVEAKQNKNGGTRFLVTLPL